MSHEPGTSQHIDCMPTFRNIAREIEELTKQRDLLQDWYNKLRDEHVTVLAELDKYREINAKLIDALKHKEAQ